MVLCAFIENGMLVRTIHEYTEDEKATRLEQGFYEISEEDLELYETLRYGYDFESGKPKELPVYEPSLEELKTAKLESLKATRDSLEVEPITYNGNNFDYDEKARDRINAAIIALDLAGADAKLSWTTANNTEAIVTANDLRGVIASVALRSNEVHIRYRELKALVENALTKEELNAITW